MTSKTLHAARVAQNDEWYTQLADIEKELQHYKNHFKNKVVYCNADDPYESNFFKYFALNFNHWELKKLITTSYSGSPIANQKFIFEEFNTPPKTAYAIEINEVKDWNGDGAIDLADVEFLLKHDKNASHVLKENGSFDSPECIEFLKEADIVTTNPPFSQFRNYFNLLMMHDKKFLIMGSLVAVGNKEIRPYFIKNKAWFGYNNGAMKFEVPNRKELTTLGFVRWYTNLSHDRRNEELILNKEYKRSPEMYFTYDDYDAIEVNKVKDIPKDYKGEMGVPISFLEKWNPCQFELVGFDRDIKKTNGKIGQRFKMNGKERPLRILIKNKNPEK